VSKFAKFICSKLLQKAFEAKSSSDLFRSIRQKIVAEKQKKKNLLGFIWKQLPKI